MGLLLAVVMGSATAQSEGPLYRATSAAGTIYLFGSVHVGEPEFYPLSAPVYAAADAADVLMVEIDITRLSPADAQVMMSMMMLPPGDSLRSHLSDGLWRRTQAAAARYGMPMVALAPLRPWAAGMMLGVAPYLRAGLDPALGVDKHLIDRARRTGVEITAIETVEDQIALFGDMPAEEEVAFLEMAVEQIEDPEGEALPFELLDAWRSGDGAAIDAIMNEAMRDAPSGLDEKVLYRRNEAMLARAIDALRDPSVGVVTVVVGAGHVVGERGLAALLREEGFDVEVR